MPAIVNLRLEEFDAITSARGWNSDKERAAHLGITQPMLSRIRSGEVPPGVKFIDSCIRVFGPLAYERLFERPGVPA